MAGVAESDKTRAFFGWRVMWAAFVLAGFGWGIGFYSPPIFLHAVVGRTGWALDQVSLAITVHFLTGALVVINLPRLVRLFGIAPVIATGALSVAVGMFGWAVAGERWQLYGAAMLTGGGWVTMSAAGINAIIARWFDRHRPVALSMAYNGAGVGGALLAPIWAYLIDWVGFQTATLIIGAATLGVVWTLAAVYFSQSPESRGQVIDGAAGDGAPAAVSRREILELPGSRLFSDPAFLTLAGGMTFALFAQVGLVSHLYSMLVPGLGERGAGVTLGVATALAIVGRMGMAWCMTDGADRRTFMAVSLGVQMVGSVLLFVFGDGDAWIAVGATLLFGLGIGNVTSLPPLIAQREFAPSDVLRVVSLMIATSQATASIAPTLFGYLREAGQAMGPALPFGLDGEFGLLFALVIVIQAGAAVLFLGGRCRRGGGIRRGCEAA